MEDELSLAPGEQPIMNSIRGLVGWMSKEEAAHFLLGRQPAPGDDLTGISEITNQCRARVNERRVWEPVNPIREMGPTTAEVIRARSDIQQAFGPLQWTPAIVDLREVLSYQPVVNLDGLDERVSSIADDPEQLVQFCLPISEPLGQLGAFIDGDQKGFTLSAINPNLQINNAILHDVDVAPGPGLPAQRVKAVSFFIGLGTSYLQVGLYKDRYFIRDGYHRAVGLLRKGISTVPCILVQARNADELGLKPGLFSYEVIYGDRPPQLVDFLDDAVACDGKRIATRTVLRIRGEQFAVQR